MEPDRERDHVRGTERSLGVGRRTGHEAEDVEAAVLVRLEQGVCDLGCRGRVDGPVVRGRAVARQVLIQCRIGCPRGLDLHDGCRLTGIPVTAAGVTGIDLDLGAGAGFGGVEGDDAPVELARSETDVLDTDLGRRAILRRAVVDVDGLAGVEGRDRAIAVDGVVAALELVHDGGLDIVGTGRDERVRRDVVVLAVDMVDDLRQQARAQQQGRQEQDEQETARIRGTDSRLFHIGRHEHSLQFDP